MDPVLKTRRDRKLPENCDFRMWGTEKQVLSEWVVMRSGDKSVTNRRPPVFVG